MSSMICRVKREGGFGPQVDVGDVAVGHIDVIAQLHPSPRAHGPHSPWALRADQNQGRSEHGGHRDSAPRQHRLGPPCRQQDASCDHAVSVMRGHLRRSRLQHYDVAPLQACNITTHPQPRQLLSATRREMVTSMA